MGRNVSSNPGVSTSTLTDRARLTCIPSDFFQFVLEISALLRIRFSFHVFKEFPDVLDFLLVIRDRVQYERITVIAGFACPLLVICISVAMVTSSTVEVRATVTLAAVSVTLDIDRTDWVAVTS